MELGFSKKKKGRKKIDVFCIDIFWCIAPVAESWVPEYIAGQLSEATRQITSLSPPDITQLHIIWTAEYLLSRDPTEIYNLNPH